MAKQTVAEKRDGEKLLVSEMIALYCRKNHHTAKGNLCPQCQALHDYALQRIERCPFMETKTFCSAFIVSFICRTASTGWTNSMRGPLHRITVRICSRISGL